MLKTLHFITNGKRFYSGNIHEILPDSLLLRVRTRDLESINFVLVVFGTNHDNDDKMSFSVFSW